jgi:2-dehydropantoate 2-reductase
MKIAVAGVGGVGGILSALLIRHGEDVSLIARGEHARAMRENGIWLRSQLLGEIHVNPALVTDDPAEVGIADVVLICVKTYSLNEMALKIAPMVGPNTLVIPLCNGIGNGDRVDKQLGKGIVLDGCIYVSSFITAPGEFGQVGESLKIAFGPRKGIVTPQMKALEKLLLDAGVIICRATEDIESEVWQKYTNVCAFAGATSYYMQPMGELQKDKEKTALALDAAKEIIALAKAKGIKLPEDIMERNERSFWKSVPEMKPSMLRDFETPGKPTEIEAFSVYVVRLGRELGVPTPAHERIARKLAPDMI